MKYTLSTSNLHTFYGQLKICKIYNANAEYIFTMPPFLT